MKTNSQPLDAVRSAKTALQTLRKAGATMHEWHHSGRCECGETMALVGYKDGMERVGFILICESCGDDDNDTINK